MSELQIALVAEGPTDRIVIEAAIEALVGATPFILKQIQPEQSAAFGPLGTGWPGVYHWCKQAAVRAGGQLRNDLVFQKYHVLVLHLDADVADKNYADAGIGGEPANLPCAMPCPPASDTTDALRNVLLSWAGEVTTPPRVVLCTPSQDTEAWVLAALFATDAAVAGGGLECVTNTVSLLQAKPAGQRLVRSGKKIRERYQQRKADITASWNAVRAICTEAERFSIEFLAAS